MSLRPAEIAPVPAATMQVAKAAFPKGCPAMRMRDELGAIYDDQMFAAAYPARGQPAHPPWRLALVTVLQFAEGLPDRQAANAVRGRIDWKYARECQKPGALRRKLDRLVAKPSVQQGGPDLKHAVSATG